MSLGVSVAPTDQAALGAKNSYIYDFLLLSIGFWKVKPHGHLPGYRSIGVFELISQRRAMRIDVVSAPILKSQWGILGCSTCENGVEVGNCTRT